jgi:hypothetical protein
MELLTGKAQKEEWVELLIDSVEKVDPSFFL